MQQETKMLYKQPSKRVKCPPFETVDKPAEGSFLYGLSVPMDTIRALCPAGPVYREAEYLKLLEKNNTNLGIPYIRPNLPKSIPLSKPDTIHEPILDVPDRVYMKLKFLKNGLIRVKLNASIWDLYNTYYRRAIKPPFKDVFQAYSKHGFSKEFMEKMKMREEKRKRIALYIDKVFTNIFDKEPVKKIKKKKEKEKEKEKDDEIIIEVHEPEEDEEEEEIIDGEMDVEPDADEEEVVEEDFESDGE